MIICQDRLGTNTRTTEQTGAVSLGNVTSLWVNYSVHDDTGAIASQKSARLQTILIAICLYARITPSLPRQATKLLLCLY